MSSSQAIVVSGSAALAYSAYNLGQTFQQASALIENVQELYDSSSHVIVAAKRLKQDVDELIERAPKIPKGQRLRRQPARDPESTVPKVYIPEWQSLAQARRRRKRRATRRRLH